MFRGVLGVSDGGVEGVDVGWWEWFLRTGAGKTLVGMGSFPSMGSKEAFKVGGTVYLDIGAGLFEIDTIKGGGQTKVFKRGVRFTRELQAVTNDIVDVIGSGGSGTGDGEVIYLAAKEDRSGAKFMGNVDVTFVSGAVEIQIGGSKDGVNVFLPKAATFRVSLEGPANGDDKGAIQSDSETMSIPFGKNIVDGKEGGGFGAGRVGIGVASVASKDLVVEGGRESTEKAEDWGFDA